MGGVWPAITVPRGGHKCPVSPSLWTSMTKPPGLSRVRPNTRESLMKSRPAIVASSLCLLSLVTTPVFAEYNGWVAHHCAPIGTSTFEKKLTGVGSSCAVIGREKNAESRAIEALEASSDDACKAIRDERPELWEPYCLEVCKFNGYERLIGTGKCSSVLTDTDTWEEDGCFSGNRQFNRQEATVRCGCVCSKDLP